MKNIKNILFVAVFASSLSSQAALAQTKGFFFNIGERLLKIDGFSYNKLEKQIQDNERQKAECLADVTKAKTLLTDREKDIKDCHAYENYQIPASERGIGFTVIDILTAGCSGTIKYHKENYGSNSSPDGKRVTEINNEIEVKKENSFGSTFSITQVKKKINPNNRYRHPYEDRIEIYPFNRPGDSTNYPPIVLGRMYEINDEKKGGTLEKGIYKSKYNVIKNANGQLEINIEGEVAQQWNHMPIGEKYNYKLFCMGKSIDELNSLATAKDPGETEISKKVFGK